MKWFLMSLAVGLVSLAGVGAAEAGGFKKHNGFHGGPKKVGCHPPIVHRPHVPVVRPVVGCLPDYHLKFGVKCHFGYCFKGLNHHHWTARIWSAAHNCFIYQCPSTHCYYYWCARDYCYYPITYCPYGVYH